MNVIQEETPTNVDDEAHHINTYAQGEEGEYVQGEEEWDEFKKKQWDEGGRSDCGYSDVVHDTLMSVGHVVHNLFGEPSDSLHTKMKGIGSYFQEASYAVRDFKRGTLPVSEVGELVKIENDDEEEDDDSEQSQQDDDEIKEETTDNF